eukprot:1896870-Prymnesium_polylepis.1
MASRIRRHQSSEGHQSSVISHQSPWSARWPRASDVISHQKVISHQSSVISHLGLRDGLAHQTDRRDFRPVDAAVPLQESAVAADHLPLVVPRQHERRGVAVGERQPLDSHVHLHDAHVDLVADRAEEHEPLLLAGGHALPLDPHRLRERLELGVGEALLLRRVHGERALLRFRLEQRA